LTNLLEYYRIRVENFEKERIEFLTRIESIKLSQEDYHKLEWELKRRNEEIVELQNLLNFQNNTINQEKQISVQLSSQIESNKIKSLDDRNRLIQLLQLAEPIEQSINLYYSKRPGLKKKKMIMIQNLYL